MIGYVHVYTGDGKGKTTAAFGLALRAAGAGMRTYIGQFVKGMPSSEIEAVERFSDRIVVRQYANRSLLANGSVPKDTDGVMTEVRRILRSGAFSLVILDEINIAVYLGLVPIDSVLGLLDCRPPEVELVLTGRSADPRILARADLVTEMREVKHYYQRGAPPRRGIES